MKDAIYQYKGKDGTETESAWTPATCVPADTTTHDEHTQLPNITISQALARAIEAEVGDLIYVTDQRWWLGGLRSAHARIHAIDAEDGTHHVHLNPALRERILATGPVDRPLQVKRLY